MVYEFMQKTEYSKQIQLLSNLQLFIYQFFLLLKDDNICFVYDWIAGLFSI